MNRPVIFVFAALLAFHSPLFSQIAMRSIKPVNEADHQGIRLPAIIKDDGDTIPVVNLHLVNISEERPFSSAKDKRQWSKLKRDVAKVYPYSKLASNKLREYNARMEGLSHNQQKDLMKQAERDLKKEFEGDIRNMTLSQGRILIKLIDRETGETSYALVEELRGSFQAFFWQSIARIFSANLKSSYNPYQNKEDRQIEDIITSIEDGTFVN